LKDGDRDAPDVALIHGKTADGQGVHIVRRRKDRLEFGAVHPLKNGVPITGEVVTLTPRKEFPLLCDVTVEVEGSTTTDVSAPTQKGPAQVATDRYRENWDRIWKRSSEPELVN
jgi:hypothetical protein